MAATRPSGRQQRLGDARRETARFVASTRNFSKTKANVKWRIAEQCDVSDAPHDRIRTDCGGCVAGELTACKASTSCSMAELILLATPRSAPSSNGAKKLLIPQPAIHVLCFPNRWAS